MNENDDQYLESEEGSELNACKKILNKTLDGNGSIEEVRLLEDIYQLNAAQAFERYNAIALGIPGMRLDLFYPEYAESISKAKEDKEAN